MAKQPPVIESALAERLTRDPQDGRLRPSIEYVQFLSRSVVLTGGLLNRGPFVNVVYTFGAKAP